MRSFYTINLERKPVLRKSISSTTVLTNCRSLIRTSLRRLRNKGTKGARLEYFLAFQHISGVLFVYKE